MRNSVKILSLTIALFVAGNLFAQDSLQVQNGKMNRHNKQSSIANQATGQKSGFVDLNGDGYNDNAPDADGDGIPNGQDPDYVRTAGMGNSNSHGRGFVDLDGDGINDNALDADGDGIPNGQDADYVRPMDGSGAQNGHSMKAGTGAGLGTGDCTGTGTGTGAGTQKGKKGGRK